MTHRMPRRSLSPLLFCCIFSGSALAASPAIRDLAKLPVDRPLGPAEQKVIADYVASRLEQLRSAKTLQQVQKARKALSDGYRVHPDSVYYQLAYAKHVAVGAGRLLSLRGDPLRPVKELHLGMAVAVMPQYEIQPALVAMSKHGSPAVRYWAAKGYRRAGRRILMMGGEHARTMTATLERMGLKESSGPVLGEVLQALGPYRDIGGNEAKALLAALDHVWSARINGLRDGRAEAVAAYRRSLGVIVRLQSRDLKAALQLAADVMEAASLALKAAKSAKADQAESVEMLKDTLLLVERYIGEMLQVRSRPIQGVLADQKKSPEERRILVRLKALNFWWPKLTAKGVRRRVKPVPTTGPATTRPTGSRPARSGPAK